MSNIADYDRNIVYCPVCGMIADLSTNALGKTRFPKHMEGGICPYCDSELMETTESYTDIVKPPNATRINPKKPWEEVIRYVFDTYVKNNPEFIPEANERMIRMKEREGRSAAEDYKKALAMQVPTPKCPKCGSTSISTQKQGFGVGKAAAGVAVAGPAGALAGGINANKVYNVCQNCGHKWELGK